jgi:glycosyltransferase involved in cell wall biosynthesis
MENKSIRILYITNMYPQEPGSHSGIFVEQEINKLRKLDLTIDLIYVNGQKNKLSYLNIIRFMKEMNECYDLINVQHSLLLPHTIITKKILNLDAPIVFTLHEGGLGNTTNPTKNPLNHLFDSILWRKPLLNYVNLIITKNIETFNVLNTEIKHIELPTAVDTDIFGPIPKLTARRKLGIKNRGIILFFPADINRPEKNYIFIKNLLPKLKNKIKGDLTILTGPQPPAKMVWFYNAADVVILPSFYECSPVVIKESMACNRPLVTSNVGDIKRVIGNTNGCFVIDDWGEEEYIDKILEAAKVRSTDGRKKVFEQGYDWDQTTKKLYTIFMTVLHKVNK